MFNQVFKDNWLNIIQNNSNISKPLRKFVRIPLTPVKIDAFTFYQLMYLLYPKFINDQQNVLDVIISNDGRKILDFYLYPTKQPGIFESIQKIPSNIIEYKENDLDNIAELFNKLQKTIIDKYRIKISLIIIFKAEIINLINNHSVNIEKIGFYNVLQKLLNFIQEIFTKKLFFLYPEPNIYKFLKNTIELLHGFSLSNIFKFFIELLPLFDFSFVLNSENVPLIFQVKKLQAKSKISDITFKLWSPKDYGINLKNLTPYTIINRIKKKDKSKSVYMTNEKSVLSLLYDIFELQNPDFLDKLQLILQKVLFGFRNFENLWFMTPKPKIYKNFRRFLVRLFGKNLNLKKISHWAIPELIFNKFKTYIGLYSKILVIITDIRNFKKIRSKNKSSNIKKKPLNSVLLIEIESNEIKKVISIKDEYLAFTKIRDLSKIRTTASKKFGYISAIIKVDKLLLEELFRNFSSQLFNFRPFSKLKIFRLIEYNVLFDVYPKFPLVKAIKSLKPKALLKSILPILIDKHEF